jgi:hypothetical protein
LVSDLRAATAFGILAELASSSAAEDAVANVCFSSTAAVIGAEFAGVEGLIDVGVQQRVAKGWVNGD